MKTLFTALIACVALTAFAQEKIIATEPEEDQKFEFDVVEKIPVIRGCANLTAETQEQQRECMQHHLVKHVGENFKYPEKARQYGVQAKIYVNFVIERDGSVSSVTVIRGATDAYKKYSKKKRQAARDLDDEAKRVIRSLQFLEPAVQRGKPVRMSFTMPINARLE
jgi:protein TonB